MKQNTKKGYIDPNTCIDGEDSHEWEKREMKEDGHKFPIKVCNKCGYWR